MTEQSLYLARALDAARAAAEIIMRYYSGTATVRTKADGSPVTVADIEAEQAIKSILLDAFPDHAMLGEETGRTRGDASFLWLVDPIDGTKSFIRSTPFFSTQIALMHAGELVLGVSSAPAFGEIAWAQRGQGAWLDGQRLAVSTVNALGDSVLSTGNLRSLAGDSRWHGLGGLVAAAGKVRGYGDFYHYHLLAAGKLDIVIESDVNVLDIAALSVIVEEAGGRFTDLEGRAINLETRSVIATNGCLYEEVAAFMR